MVQKGEFIIPFPKKTPGKPTCLDLRLTVTQYVTAYGLEVMNEAKLKGYQEEAHHRKELSDWIVKNYESLKNLLIWLCENLRPHRKDKAFFLKGEFNVSTKEESQFLSSLEFTVATNGTIGTISRKLTGSEIKFLTGGWLEEFSFNTVSSYLGQGINDVVIGIRLKNSKGRENEFDVMFTKDNALYFVECKSLDQKEDEDANNALYKVGALQREFGLRVESFFVTTSPHILNDGKIREAIRARAEQFKTTVVSPSEINQFKDIIARKLKIN